MQKPSSSPSPGRRAETNTFFPWPCAPRAGIGAGPAIIPKRQDRHRISWSYHRDNALRGPIRNEQVAEMNNLWRGSSRIPKMVGGGVSAHCLHKHFKPDAIDRCTLVFGEFPLLPVECDDLLCQRCSLVLSQVFGNDPPDLRSATLLPPATAVNPVSVPKSDIFHPGIAAEAGASRHTPLELGRCRYSSGSRLCPPY